MKRLLSFVLMLSLLASGSAMAQSKKGRSGSRKAKTERTHKKSGTKKAVAQDDELTNEADALAGAKVKELDYQVLPPPVDQNTGGVIYNTVDQMPQYPGGLEGLMNFLAQNINYPPAAAEKKIQGRVVLMFVVEKDGSIGEVNVVRSVDKELDDEAVRVVKSLPNFIPGRLDGQVVRVWFTLPISFKLTDDDLSKPAEE